MYTNETYLQTIHNLYRKHSNAATKIYKFLENLNNTIMHSSIAAEISLTPIQLSNQIWWICRAQTSQNKKYVTNINQS